MVVIVNEHIDERRTIGKTNIAASPVAMGCSPITGMTSVGVTEADSLAALEAAFDAGINFFDTAYCYGMNGESEGSIAKEATWPPPRSDRHRHQGRIHWSADGKQIKDGRAETLRRQCEESLRRLNTDHVELLYLHAPDPSIPLEESAGALKRLLDEGKTRSMESVKRKSLAQLQAFAAVCPLSAYQPHYNMLRARSSRVNCPGADVNRCR